MLRYLLTVRREINVLVALALGILLLKVFWLNTVPEWFSWGAEIGEIIDRLCASILSSYLFFLIVVHLKSEKDKENLNPYVFSRVQRIVGDCTSQLSDFQNASGISLSLDNLQRQEVETAFRGIGPNAQAPLILGFRGNYANWLQYMNYHRTRTIQVIEKLYRKITFLDSRLVQNLADLDDCSHFGSIEFLAGNSIPVNNTNLEAWASSFYDYCVIVRRLNEYANEKLSIYRPGL